MSDNDCRCGGVVSRGLCQYCDSGTETPTIEVIAGFGCCSDQDGDPVSIARKIEAFAIARKLRGAGVRAGTVIHTEEENRYDALEDQIESVNRQLPDGWQIGWHPDDSGTIVYARSAWFDFESPSGKYGT